MPSQASLMHDEIVHFYIDHGSLEEPNAEDEDTTEEYNAIEAPLLANPQQLPMNTLTLG